MKIYTQREGDLDIYAGLDTPERRKKHFDTFGHVVVRGLVPTEVVDSLVAIFERDAKSYKGSLRRFPLGNDPHTFDDHGRMLLGIREVQNITDPSLEQFVAAAKRIVLGNKIRTEIKNLFPNTRGTTDYIFFDANTETGAHQDGAYAKEKYEAVAVWTALEDIHPDAGPLYVIPTLEVPILRAENNSAHLRAVQEEIEKRSLQGIAPLMRKGDVGIWRDNIIHGSQKTIDSTRTRRSLAARYYRQNSL